ncbi:hypothetical protein N7472_005476 [Penicillium cf. griseofulvum]|uniref:Uncharacterized protein n=1 Tax=Penicillium cf. griseofulvum TaxID=2972120 RepID=A0A9W9MG13_9EURO|nr:hypothetical protein N7472_005476 [Penicillium cf. griseofulvum]KAJ5431034.1 hypothetical protein N7445_008766 [Penicillium cf. griseofulvum]
MHLFTISAAIAASLSMVQFCPAPPAVLGPIIGGALAGEAGGIVGYGMGKIGKRSIMGSVLEKRSDPFAGLPQPAADTCKNQLNGVKVKFTPTGQGAFRVDNVPSACMTLSNVILGQDPNQPAPTPLGSAALGYSGLSEEDINKLQGALEGKGY